jgi:hypothetical protein
VVTTQNAFKVCSDKNKNNGGTPISRYFRVRARQKVPDLITALPGARAACVSLASCVWHGGSWTYVIPRRMICSTPHARRSLLASLVFNGSTLDKVLTRLQGTHELPCEGWVGLSTALWRQTKACELYWKGSPKNHQATYISIRMKEKQMAKRHFPMAPSSSLGPSCIMCEFMVAHGRMVRGLGVHRWPGLAASQCGYYVAAVVA